uniref:Ionotropic receptor 75a N-terminal domain-containing protein n=1 Tax=Anopheles culicifacies TaxID=139723 RepID=A0A182M8U0_9DIPT
MERYYSSVKECDADRRRATRMATTTRAVHPLACKLHMCLWFPTGEQTEQAVVGMVKVDGSKFERHMSLCARAKIYNIRRPLQSQCRGAPDPEHTINSISCAVLARATLQEQQQTNLEPVTKEDYKFLPWLIAASPANRDLFVVDFLTLKHCKHAIIFDCSDSEHGTTLDRAYVLRAANTRSVSIRFIDIASDNRQHNVTTIFTPRQYAKLCTVLDYRCPGAPKLLDQVRCTDNPEGNLLTSPMVSQHRYMNSTISWLLLSRNTTGTALQRTLWNTAGIQMNSDLITGVETADQGVFNVFDIYSKGRHLCKDIYQTLLGRWSNESGGIRLMPHYSTYKIRQNFNFLQLRGVTVIDRENVTSEQVDRLLSEPGLTKGIVAFVKYHYALLVVLRDFHNFTIKYRPTRGWAGRLRSGYRLGLLGVVQRHETDVAATGIIMRLSRQPELDSIHYSWAFETGFIYKITPDIGSKSEGNGFVAPFSPSVWVTFLVSLALAVVVLKCLAQLSERCLRHRERARATMAYVLDVMSCVAQQGVPHVSRLVPSRVAVIVLLVANLVLYNYYTSTVVSGLLSSKMIGPESIPQVIDSPLKLSLTDTGYHRILLREQTLPYSTRMHERKALPPRSPDDLPLFTDVEHAVPYLRRGGHVLHCELTEVYPTIANQFTANEICELRTVEGLYKYDIRVMAFVLPKHSMYGELFKITLMRAQETGIVKRIYRIHKIAKPICQGSATVYSVELTEVSLAFIILGGFGIALSGLIYLVEKRDSIRRVVYQQSNENLEQIIDNFDVVGSGAFQNIQQKPLNVQILMQSWIYRF